MAEPFIYNQYSCEEALREAGFDLEQVKEYLCYDEIETLKADVYAATQDRDYYEAGCDEYNSALNERIDFLDEIENDLRVGRKTKAAIADKIRAFLNEH